jgi:hypothetical protein
MSLPRFFRLDLDLDEVEEPFVIDADGPRSEIRCEACRSLWFDPEPGPMEIDVEEPEGGWEQLRPGILPGPGTPTLVVAPEVVAGLRARGIESFVDVPLRVRRVDGEPAGADDAGGPWVGLWPRGVARRLATLGGDEELLACEGCGRHHGEFEAPFAAAIVREGWDGGPLFAVPGWRYTTFATEAAVSALRELGLRFVRAVEVPCVPAPADRPLSNG